MRQTLTHTSCCTLALDGHDMAWAATPHDFTQAAPGSARGCWDEGLTTTTTTTITAHHRVYGETREPFGRGAQVAVYARATAVQAIQAVKAKRRDTGPTVGARSRVRSEART